MIDPTHLLTILLLTPAPAGPVLLSEPEAKSRAVAFLTCGGAPPRRLLTRAAQRRLRGALDHDATHGPCVTFRYVQRGRLRLSVRIERSTGRVIALNQPDRGMVVATHDRDLSPRPAAERRAEIDRRARSRVELGRAARAFLRQLYPALDRRRFVLVRERRLIRGEQVARRYVFEERRGPGVRALFVNRAVLELDPEAATLVRAHATQLSHEVRSAPPVRRRAAVAAARRLLGEPAVRSRSSLRVVRVAPRRLRVVWSVRLGRRRVRIDARTGRRLRYGPL